MKSRFSLRCPVAALLAAGAASITTPAYATDVVWDPASTRRWSTASPPQAPA